MAGETLITFVGNVVDDSAELRFTPSGAAVAKFRMASTARKFDKATSSWIDQEPTFLTVNVWRDQAEHAAETLQKGMRVVVVGQLRSRSYEKDGQKRTVFEIEADEVAPSLKFATAQVTRAQRQGQSGGGQQRGADQWSTGQPSRGGWGGQQPASSAEAPF